MDAAHVVILQRNHKYLKEKLQVDPVLDALYQDCVFTQVDYDSCRQAGTEKCEMLLEILKKKGVEGYRTLCTVLDTTQPFIKERLDGTSTEAGLTTVIFVNKIKLEAQHRKEIEEYEKQIALLQSDINDLKQQLEQLRGIQDTLEKTKHKEAKDHISQIKEQGLHIDELKSHLAKSQGDLLKANEKCDGLKKMLEEEQEAYKALVGLPAPHIPDTSGNTEENMDEERPFNDKKQTCVLSVHGHCDVDKLRLLPCLHAACESCIEKHFNEERRYKLVCPCGQNFTMAETAPDFVRRNEAAYAANSEKEKRCSYLQITHDTNCVVYCKECNDNLCPNCLNIHNSIRQNSNHTVREISETKITSIDRLLRQDSHCVEHPDNKLQLYDHNCRKPICVVCLHGAHERHMNSDLKHLHDETKNHLFEELGKQESKLQDIRDTLKCAKHHRHKLEETKLKLETDIMTIHRNVAVKFLRRQATLLQDIPLNLKVHNEAVQAQIDFANDVEASVVRTIDYIQRALKSTRHWELIYLTQTINKMSEENMKAGKFTADSRSTQVRFCFQGKKALEELIDTSGCLATTMKPDDIPDKQPTIADLQNQIDIFAQNASKLENRLDETLKVVSIHQQRWMDLEKIVCKLLGVNLQEHKQTQMVETNRGVQPGSLPKTPDVYEMMKTMMSEGVRSHDVHQSCIKLKVCPSNVDIVGHGASARLLVCPVLHMDAARANKKCCHVNSLGELINSPPDTHEQDRDSFKMYFGTCSSTPIFVPQQPSAKPNCDPPSPQYWETQSVVGVASEELHLSILETGVSGEGQMDKWYRACNQFRSWSVRVWSCDRHRGRICTNVYREGERGRCLTDTMPHSPGAQATLHYGVVLDVERGRLGFIDLDREVVLAKIDVEIREPLYPMFGVVPKSSECTVNMKLICGEDITMTATKKSLIYKVLTQ